MVEVGRYVCGLFNWLTDPKAVGLVTQGPDIRELRLLGYQSKGTDVQSNVSCHLVLETKGIRNRYVFCLELLVIIVYVFQD